MSKKYRLLAILLSVLLVFSGWRGLLPEQLVVADSPQPDLFISEYVEGSSFNKALEIYNPTTESISLGNDAVKIEFYQNGSTTPKRAISLSGTLLPGKTYVIVCSDANADLKLVANYVDQGDKNDWFNGDDAVVLWRNGAVVDRFGQVGERTPWGVDTTLVRKPTIKSGDTNLYDTFVTSLEWTQYSKDTFSNLGWHKMGVYSVRFSAYPGQFRSGTVVEREVEENHEAEPPSPNDIIPPEGFVFDGWDTDDYLNVTKPLWVTATYKQITYTVSFNLAGKGVLEEGSPDLLTQTVNHGDDVISPQVRPTLGYTLLGWDKTLTNIKGDVEVNAIYEEWSEPDLFFSEYIEGSSNNKALEIYNPTADAVDLAAGDYAIVMYFNYGDEGSSGYRQDLKIPLTGTIQAHDTYVLKHSGATFITTNAQQTNGAGWYNGNDLVVLMRGTAIIDEIGKSGENPDPNVSDNTKINGWQMGDVQTGNKTLVRKPWVSRGVVHDELALFDPSVQWIAFDQDYFGNLGSHACDVVHLVTFDPNGAKVRSGNLVQSVYTGRHASAPLLQPPTGHSFSGWSQAFNNVEEDLLIKALWVLDEYAITFDSAGGSPIPAISQDFGTPITPPEDPVRTGYTFLGWEPALPDTMPLEGMELVAQWRINQYRLVFDSDGGSPLAPQVLDYGSEIRAPINPLRLGYRFMGWEPALPDRMGASDLTVKALWQKEGVVEDEDDEVPGQGTPGAGDKPGSGQGTDLDRVPVTGENLPITESFVFLGLALLLRLIWRRRLIDQKRG